MCHLIETPLIRDMRRTARDLGITELLRDLRGMLRSRLREDDESFVVLDEAMTRLGVDPPVRPAALSSNAPDPRD